MKTFHVTRLSGFACCLTRPCLMALDLTRCSASVTAQASGSKASLQTCLSMAEEVEGAAHHARGQACRPLLSPPGSECASSNRST